MVARVDFLIRKDYNSKVEFCGVKFTKTEQTWCSHVKRGIQPGYFVVELECA